MAINNVITDDWSGHSHGEVEEALKDKLSEMSQGIEEAAQAGYAPPTGGIPYSDLAKAVRDILDSVSDKVDKVNGKGLSTEDFTSAFKTKLESLGNYDDTQIQAAVSALQSALDGLATVATSGSYNDLKDKPVIPAGSVVDDALSDSSVNAVQNKVVKAAIDGLQDALNTLIGGNVHGAIDTFNEVRAFLDGIDTDEPTLASQLLALDNAITELRDTLASKVEKETGKGLSSNDYTTAEKQKLAGLPTNPVQSITVNGGTAQTPTNGNVNIIVPQGEKGEKGDTGNVEFEDLADLVALLVNDLTTGGGGNFLSAEMGLVLRREITRVHDDLVTLYGKLANMAFWDATDRAAAQPRSLNFNVPQVSLSFDLTGVGSGVSVKLNGESFNSPVSVDKGSTNTLTIQAAEYYTLNNDVAITIGGVSQTITKSGEVYSLQIIASNNMAITVVATAFLLLTTAPKSDVYEGSSLVQCGMQLGTIESNGSISDWRNILIPRVESASNAGSTAAYYIATNGKDTITLKTKPAPTGYFYITAMCYYDSSFQFIEKTKYFPHFEGGDWTADRTIPSGTAYIKIVLVRKESPNNTLERNVVCPSGFVNAVFEQAEFNALANDFFKYCIYNS